MLLRITRYDDLDERALMDIYTESNFENTAHFFPAIVDKKDAVGRVEASFLNYLEQNFFTETGNTCWILEVDGIWVSAVRTYTIRPGVYYSEALETRPDSRKKGYAAQLLSGVLDCLKAGGMFCFYDCVDKTNIALLRTHEKCGFQIVSEDGYNYLTGESDDRDYGMEYRYLEG